MDRPASTASRVAPPNVARYQCSVHAPNSIVDIMSCHEPTSTVDYSPSRDRVRVRMIGLVYLCISSRERMGAYTYAGGREFGGPGVRA
jgi:hypothetical protein